MLVNSFPNRADPLKASVEAFHEMLFAQLPRPLVAHRTLPMRRGDEMEFVVQLGGLGGVPLAEIKPEPAAASAVVDMDWQASANGKFR